MVTVIIIDDDSDTVEVLSEFLQIYGIQVIGKGFDGKEALELYKNSRPDIVFLDVMMPKFDGFYALEKIKQFDPSAKIIMVTADVNQGTYKKLNELGATCIIYKPFDIKVIIDIIKKLESGIPVSF